MKEKGHARKLVDNVLSAGHSISVFYDGDCDFVVRKSINRTEILSAMEAVDMCRIIFHEGGSTFGSALIVYGNDPDEEVADYSVNRRTEELIPS